MKRSLPKMIVEVQNVTRNQARGHKESPAHGKQKGRLGALKGKEAWPNKTKRT